MLPPGLFVDSIDANNRIHVESEEDILNILKSRHDSPMAGHLGRARTYELISREFFWPTMRKDIYNYVDACDICQRTKSPRHKPFGLLQPLPIPSRPWSSISMDFIVKLPQSKNFDSIFVVVCRLTKQAHFIPCKESISAAELAEIFIDKIFRYHGLPDEIISDRGPQFRSRFWKALMNQLHVDPKTSTAYHPETDGQTERTNQCLEQYLRCFVCFSQDDWSNYLPFAEFAFNNAQSTSTGTSPFFANYGFHPRLDYTVNSNYQVPSVENYLNNLNSIIPILKDELASAQTRMKHYADKSRKDHKFQVNDLVWLLKRNIKSTRPTSKLDHKRLGPFKIIKQINPVTFELELPTSYRIHNCFHVSLLEPVNEAYLLNPKEPPLESIVVDDQEVFYVDKILDSKMVNEKHYYLIKWYGCPDSENTWEPIDNLTGCDEALNDFNAHRSKFDSAQLIAP